jgi:PAS domain S-box-containing protein
MSILPLFTTRQRHRLALTVIGGIGAIASLTAHRLARHLELMHAQTEFERRAETLSNLTRAQLLLYEEMLLSLREVFIGSGEVSRAEFRRLSAHFLQRHAGIQALEWVPLVPQAGRAAFEERLSREIGRPGQITERDAAGRFRPAAQHPEYLPIFYAEPMAGNDSILGYNITTAPTREYLTAARRSRRPVVTPPFQLAQLPENELGIVFALPVYWAGDDAGGQFRGFIQGVFHLRTMLGQSTAGAPDLDIVFTDPTANVPHGGLVFWNHAGAKPADPPAAAPDCHLTTLRLGDRLWNLRIQLTPERRREQQSPLPWLVFAGGLLTTGVAVAFSRNFLQQSERVEHEVVQRTAELRAAHQLIEEDVARRAATERSLRESELRLQAVIDHSPGLIFVKDLAGRYVLFNRAFEQLCQRPAAEITGRTDQELFSTVQAEASRANDRQVLESNHPMEFEETAMSSHGLTVSIVQKFPLRDATGLTYALCGIATDITSRKQAEADLQESRRQLANLVSQLPGTAFRCAADEVLTVYFASDGLFSLTGYRPEEFVGKANFAQLTLPDDRPRASTELAQALRERRAYEIEYRIRHRDGSERWVLVRGRPIYAADGALRFLEGLAIDVTALKRAEREKLAIERQLLEAKKLESLGVLAGGIAHDFNNLLTAVLGNASLIRQALRPDHTAQLQLQHIENAARRAADLCAQMLAYAGKGKFVTTPVDPSALVRDTTALLQVSVAKGTRLQLDLAEKLPPVLADATQLRQIIMNLVLNAADAIGERADGLIRIGTMAGQLPAGYFQTAVQKPPLPAGHYVILEISDNGSGMTPETLARIFEPFFTTKFSGRGLGLSAVLGIIRGHRGALFVESQPGAGTTFRVALPAHEPEAAASQEPPAAATTAGAPLRGRVLLVDDEHTVRQVAATVLTRHGVRVLQAADGNEALQLCRERTHAFDLILLDLTMPGLSGEETLRQLRVFDQRQKVVVMSGYSEVETMRRCASLGVAGFLAKPFEIDTLLSRVRQHLA